MESLNHHLPKIGAHFRGSWELLKFLRKEVNDQIIITVGKCTLIVKLEIRGKKVI